jgi:hypothetical protein
MTKNIGEGGRGKEKKWKNFEKKLKKKLRKVKRRP